MRRCMSVRVDDIWYDIDESDANENGTTIEEIDSELPHELVLEVDYDPDEMSEVEAITEVISDETGWCVISYNYSIEEENIKEDE